MHTSAARLALAAALTAVTALGPASAVMADEVPAPSASAEPLTPSSLGAGNPARDGGERLSASATAGELVEMSRVCPSGYVVDTLYDAASFESGLPDPGNTNGWAVAGSSSSPGADGTRYATSTVSPTGAAQAHWLAAVEAPVPTTGSLYVIFAYRGTFGADTAFVDFNSVAAATLPAVAAWTYKAVDVTGAKTADGSFYIDFGNVLAATATSGSTFQVDDVMLYDCTPAPNAGVRGDWTGEGTVDLLGTHSTGDLYLYPGKGNGAVGSGAKLGSGWAGYTWLGSPGDVTGDRRTDLVGRRGDGNLYLYAGRGAGDFASVRQVGSSWGGMTALATPTDMTLDGRPELVARRSDGTLHLYSFGTTGTLGYVKRIGSGWNGMAWIIGMGDLSGDRRGDVVGVAGNGCLYAYTTTLYATLGSARQVGCGWGAMDWLTSPGDLNRDGYGDLIARDTSGRLWFYRGKAGGGVYSGIQVGSGWQGMTRIL